MTDAEQAAGRITVTLTPRAGDSLRRLQDRTGLSKTDIANRAIILYEFIQDQAAAGADIVLRNGAEDAIVYLL